MKITVELTLKKAEGAVCTVEEVFDTLESDIDGEMYFAQSADSDDESEYEVTSVRLVEDKK